MIDQAPLLDVTEVSFDVLLADGSPNLAACVERILIDLDDPDGVISAFQSFALNS